MLFRSTIMALSLGFVCAFAASDNRSSSVYCSNVPDDGAVVDSTALTGCGGGCVTCLRAACFAASFHILPEMAFSNRLLANGSITSVTHSEVSLAFLLSQWRTFSSSSVDEHGCRSQHVSNSNSASIKHLSLLPSPTASSQPTLPRSIHHLSFIIHHQWQLLISSLLNHHLNFPNIQ